MASDEPALKRRKLQQGSCRDDTRGAQTAPGRGADSQHTGGGGAVQHGGQAPQNGDDDDDDDDDGLQLRLRLEKEAGFLASWGEEILRLLAGPSDAVRWGTGGLRGADAPLGGTRLGARGEDEGARWAALLEREAELHRRSVAAEARGPAGRDLVGWPATVPHRAAVDFFCSGRWGGAQVVDDQPALQELPPQQQQHATEPTLPVFMIGGPPVLAQRNRQAESVERYDWAWDEGWESESESESE